MRDKRIGVLCGGLSAEREVSLATGEAVSTALAERGWDVRRLFVDRDVDLVLRQSGIQVAFLALHGRYGEDGCVQGLLELMGIPYTGSSVLASALAMNKVKAKELFRLHNLPTAPYYVVGREDELRVTELHGTFGFPVVVKPSGEGSSIGVRIATDESELLSACEEAFRWGDEVLVERWIEGREVSVAVLDDRPLGAIEIVPSQTFYDYGAKYTPGRSSYHLPARLAPARYRGVLTQALMAHKAIGASGATRVDFIVSERGNEVILEVNTIPGLTPTSLLPKMAAHAGIGFGELCERMLLGAQLHAGVRTRGERRAQQMPFPGPDRRAGAERH